MCLDLEARVTFGLESLVDWRPVARASLNSVDALHLRINFIEVDMADKELFCLSDQA